MTTRRWTLLGLCLAASCGEAPDEPPAAGTAEAVVEAAAEPPSRAAGDADRLISGGGIGRARRGMTIAELRAALAPEMTLGERAPFMVDLDGMPVVLGGDTLFHALVYAEDPPADSAAVELLAAVHPSVRTAEGIGPGSTLAEAAAAYGPPTLSYNTDDESREYARFPGYPSESVHFRVAPATDTSFHAGVYTTQGAYNETTTYDPAARVMMILVSLR